MNRSNYQDVSRQLGELLAEFQLKAAAIVRDALSKTHPGVKPWSVPGLTKRQAEVMDSLVRKEGTLKEIACDLGVSESAIKYHANRIYKKLGVSSRRELLHKHFLEVNLTEETK